MTKGKVRKRLESFPFDGFLLAVVIVLLIYGLIALFSATFYVGDSYWKWQLVWIAVGAVAAIIMYKVPYPIWQKLALLLMAVNILMLLITIIFAKPVQGVGADTEYRRGLLGGSIQPGVSARFVAVIYIAAWLSSKGEQLNQVKYGLLPFGMILGAVAGLVAFQPDLSTTLLIAVTGIAMFFFAGGDPLQIFIAIFVSGSTLSMIAWQWKHARDRLLVYIASLQDPAEMPYHIEKSVQAISDGGIFGTGLGYGRLKFGYLPFPWTDSIFAVIGEETGLIGCLLVLVLFTLFAIRGYRITLGTPDAFGSLVAFGLTTMILTEALLNILVMLGLFPPTGTALPFFSYGGTGMLMTLTSVGLLLGISRGRPKGDWDAVLDRWWRDGWARLSGSGRRSSFARHRS